MRAKRAIRRARSTMRYLTQTTMPFQPQRHTAPRPESLPSAALREVAPPPASPSRPAAEVRIAPVWLQRVSLIVLVIFCLYLGAMVAILPWWSRVWEMNPIVLNHPLIGVWLRNGVVRGVLTGIGLLDIWIGISEAIHYRDYRG